MTNSDWIVEPDSFRPQGEDNFLREFKAEYQKALFEYMRVPALQRLQKNAKKASEIAPPDLWFIKMDGTFLFVEAKLDKKEVTEPQIAGLALLYTILGAEVKIIRVCRKGRKVALNDFTDVFCHYCELFSTR